MTDAKECDCCGGMWGYINNDGEHDNVWDCVTELTKQRDAARRERDEARQDAAAMREMLATAFREGWNCGDWKEDRDNVSAREYDWMHSAVKAKADAALTPEDA